MTTATASPRAAGGFNGLTFTCRRNVRACHWQEAPGYARGFECRVCEHVPMVSGTDT